MNHKIKVLTLSLFFFRMPSVNSFGIWEKLSFKVFVKKRTDENKLKKKLLKMNKDFFDKFNLEIVKGKFLVKKTLKQGDRSFGIQSFIKISLNYCYFQFDQSGFQSTLFLVHL